jgi:hypothetical protein
MLFQGEPTDPHSMSQWKSCGVPHKVAFYYPATIKSDAHNIFLGDGVIQAYTRALIF